MKPVQTIYQISAQSAPAWMAYGDRVVNLLRLGKGRPEML